MKTAQRDIVLPTTSRSGTRTKADCLVLDLDGTLLNRDCVITSRTAEALREVVAAGVTVFIATGKARPAAIRAAATAAIPLDGPGGVVSTEHPGVFLQGLDVYGKGGVGLYKAEMPRDVVIEAFDEIYGRGSATSMALTAFCGDACATLAGHPLLDELASKYHEPESVPWENVETLMRAAAATYAASGGAGDVVASRDGGVVVGDVDVDGAHRLNAARASGVQKLLLMGDGAQEIDAIRPRWEASFGSRAEVTQAVPNMLEVLPPGNGKARGVETLLAHLGVDVDKVVAVGDGENDIDMLRLVGCGVAMGNAGDAVRRAADHVLTTTNDEDGVAEAVERFVFF